MEQFYQILCTELCSIRIKKNSSASATPSKVKRISTISRAYSRRRARLPLENQTN